MGQLLIRPSLNDHQVIADLVARPAAPTLRAARPPVGQLVADAHIALQRPTLAVSANEAGIPFLIDPMTPLLQSEIDPKNAWARLPFAVASKQAVQDIDLGALVEQVVQFQVDQGASRIIAPYLYAIEPADAAFSTSIRLLAATARYLDDANLPLPIVAVFCGQLQHFGRTTALDAGIRRFVTASRDHDVQTIGLCVSPLGAPTDSYSKLVGLFRMADIAAGSSIPTVAWRQGIYGPALVAAGLAGYETGIGSGEQTNIVRQASNRRAKPPTRGGGAAGIFLDQLGRSVPKRVAQVLLGSAELRAKLLCDDERCCATVSDTLDRARQHTVRSRARQLTEIADQPHRRWRLHHVAQHAQNAGKLARQANKVLEAEGVKHRVGLKNLEALGQVLTELAQADQASRSA